MTFDLAVVLLLMLACFAGMVWEKVSVDVVALGGMGMLIVTGVLTPREAFSVFSNDAAITVASMFVLSAALIRTGALEGVTRWFDRVGGGSETRLLMLVLPATALLSAFVNNTPIVVMLMPILIAQAAKHQLNQSALLLPMSYASILGGLCTLIGTSTTILVSSTAERLGQAPIRMFEFTPMGLILLVAGFTFLSVFGRRLLPARSSLSDTIQSTPRSFLSELVVTPDSNWIGQPLSKTPFTPDSGFQVLDVRRRGGTVAVPLSEIHLKEGDVLRVTSPLERLVEIQSLPGLNLRAQERYASSIVSEDRRTAKVNKDFPAEALRLVESVVSPRSRLVGRTVRKLDFRRRYGVLVLAVHRRGGKILERDFANISLEAGDTLLLQGEEDAIQRLEADDDFLVLTTVQHQAPRRSKRPIVIAVAVAVVALATAGVLPISALALIGALLCVIFRCLDSHEAYHAIEWRIIMLIFGMLSLGLALEKTGGAKLAAEGLVRLFADAGPWVMLSMVLLLTSASTEFLSNNAVAVLFTPIVIQVAEELGVDVRPFLMAVVLGASASFATPIGYQTNTLVYGAGGYKFSDFLRVGLPMNAIVWLLGSLLIPVFWPFLPK
jgi:di/tricarboxylate transporter